MPKVSRSVAQAHRQEILDAAARVFHERGFDGVSVAELMAAAGLTHGGFYGHFASKETLMAQAFDRAIEQSRTRWRDLGDEEEDAGRARRRFITAYLSGGHRDRPGGGCPMAALASDVARQPDGTGLRAAYGEAVSRWAERLTALQPQEVGSKSRRRKRALTEMAALVGALVLARATRGDALSEEVLQAVRGQLLAADA